MNGLDLFSGIGGITKALDGYVTPVAYCENDRYAQAVLLSRMADGQLPTAPIWDDVTSLRGSMLPGGIDIIYGGFPCQDISVAGRGAGLEGKRSGLFFEIARLVGELRPRFIFLENVPAIARRGGDAVVGTLADLGYDCRWDVLSAADVGANHLRERWWLLAHAQGDRFGATRELPRDDGDAGQRSKSAVAHASRIGFGQNGTRKLDSHCQELAHTSSDGRGKIGAWESSASGEMADTASDSWYKRSELGIDRREDETKQIGLGRKKSNVAHTESVTARGLSIRTESQIPIVGKPGDMANTERDGWKEPRDSRVSRRKTNSIANAGWWSVEPNVGRVANGIPKRVDRLCGLGNAVVPAQAREAFERLIGLN